MDLDRHQKKIKRDLTKRQKTLLGVAFLAVLLVLWQILALLIHKNYLLPGPYQVLQSILQNWSVLWRIHLPMTLGVMGTGCGISVLLGIFLAILMDLHEGIEQAVYPLLTFTQTVPVLCIAPVLVLWFGYSFLMRVVVVILVTFFSITVNVYDGFRTVRCERTELLMTYGAGYWQQLHLLRFPTALPQLLQGLHVAIPWAGVGAVIAEWLGAPGGIGVFSKTAMMRMDAAGLLAPLILLSAILLLINAGLKLLESVIQK